MKVDCLFSAFCSNASKIVNQLAIRKRPGAEAFSSVDFTLLEQVNPLAQLGAATMTPSEMEKWAKRTRFGNRSSGKFKSWAEEEAELNKLFSPPEKKAPAAPSIPTMIFPIMIPGNEPPPGPQMA